MAELPYLPSVTLFAPPQVHFEPYVALERQPKSAAGDRAAEEGGHTEGLFSCPMYRTRARRKVQGYLAQKKHPHPRITMGL